MTEEIMLWVSKELGEDEVLFPEGGAYDVLFLALFVAFKRALHSPIWHGGTGRRRHEDYSRSKSEANW